ncbi:tetratricopeptide repeat protein [Bizionia sp.]|uniref:tetratricopeptide repeat protein n=1 Tax=Bizionia sp. TaxID=1954480 RepID=UPI003A8D57BB
MNNEELIEKYFNNQLSDTEFKQVEALLENDAAFKKEFYCQLEVQQAIAKEKRKPLKQRLKKLDQNTKKSNSWYVFAAAILVILFSIGMFYFDNQPKYTQLYAQNFEPYPNVMTLTNRSEDTGYQIAEEAFENYNAGNYERAAENFKAVYTNDPQDYILFYQGVSLLASGKIQKGIQVLEDYDWKDNQSDFETAAYWYLALAYIKIENKEAAITLLSRVSNAESNLNKPAKKLLESLK